MTPAEFHEVCLLVCPYCSKGLTPDQRPATREWVHNIRGRGFVLTHSICWANGLRNSRFATEATT